MKLLTDYFNLILNIFHRCFKFDRNQAYDLKYIKEIMKS